MRRSPHFHPPPKFQARLIPAIRFIATCSALCCLEMCSLLGRPCRNRAMAPFIKHHDGALFTWVSNGLRMPWLWQGACDPDASMTIDAHMRSGCAKTNSVWTGTQAKRGWCRIIPSATPCRSRPSPVPGDSGRSKIDAP